MNIVNRNEALRYLGFGKTPPDEATAELLNRSEELLKKIEPRFIYEKFSAGDFTFGGNDVAAHLEDCSEIVILAATLGTEADRIIRTLQVTDMAQAVVFDALASAAIEEVCNYADLELRERYAPLNATWRFSPGYGDFPLDTQLSLLNALNAQKKIGLTLSDSGMLVPVKSVTAIVGLSVNEITLKRRSCAFCKANTTCRFRKDGQHC